MENREKNDNGKIYKKMSINGGYLRNDRYFAEKKYERSVKNNRQ